MKYKIIKTLLITCIGLVVFTPNVNNINGEETDNNIAIEEVENNEDENIVVPTDETEKTDDVEKVEEKDETKASDKTETVKEDSGKQTVEVKPVKPVKPEKIEDTKEPEQTEKTEDEEVIETNTEYKKYTIPSNSGFKSYMSYKSITSKSSYQYKLQSQYAYTGNYGIRQVNGRYCIAIGTFSTASVGTYVDLILENGTVIPCIVGDFKAPVHTDSSNIVTLHNGCVSEFIVDINNLHSTAKRMGNVSYCEDSWKSPVKEMKVYNTNVFGTK